MKKTFFILLLIAITGVSFSQVFAQGDTTDIVVSYTNPEEFTIGGITISGAKFLDENALISLTNLKIGDKITIPGDQLSSAIRKIWDQGLIGDIQVSARQTAGKTIYLDLLLKERPRLSRFTFKGVKKGDFDDLNSKIDISRGRIVNDALIKNAKKKVRNFYVEKGFLNTVVNITPEKDSLLSNNVVLKVTVEKKHKVRIDNIFIVGNNTVTRNKLIKEQKKNHLLADSAQSDVERSEKKKFSLSGIFSSPDITEGKLKSKMKKTKQKDWYKIFTTSKLIKKQYDEDKTNIIDYYNSKGYRDATIVSDSIIHKNDKYVDIVLNINEGRKYYFRNITWTGNYIYDDKTLSSILNIKKGDVYNIETMQKRLSYNPQGYDVSSLYLDDGYLFFNVDPVEVLIEGDSIDMEMRVFEGTQAIIDNVTIAGNTKTHDHVILREVRTLPGQKFSRADLIRSTRELAALGYFDQEELMSGGVSPVPNPQKGTVDIHYKVVEKPSDQIELSGGYGGYYGIVGTLGLTFNNFSAKNITKFKTWSPLPSGDGQRLSVRFQANGPNYQTYSLSFTEPWLGGKKPRSLGVSLSHSRSSFGSSGYGGIGSLGGGLNGVGGLNNQYYGSTSSSSGNLSVNGVTVTLGQRIKWPDDYFTLSNSISFLQYRLNNYPSGITGFSNGPANNLSLSATLSRNSIDDFTFPTGGSNVTLSVTATPPYSVFDKRDYSTLDAPTRYKWIEYHKWMLDNTWYTTLVPGKKRNLVLSVRGHFGFIGSYKKTTGIGPFERFILGGSGLSGFNYLLGSDIIGLRGYDNNVIRPIPNGPGGVIYDKLVSEIRYPLNISPAFSLFVLGFFEAGNSWSGFQDFNPFNNYRSVGLGARIFMPAFGLIGIDYGKALDNIPGYPGGGHNSFTFTIGQQIR